jgi:hypothetical protein
MQRHHRVPVQQAEQTARLKQSDLLERRLTFASWLDPGSFISARSDKRRSRSKPVTLQKSSASP